MVGGGGYNNVHLHNIYACVFYINLECMYIIVQYMYVQIRKGMINCLYIELHHLNFQFSHSVYNVHVNHKNVLYKQSKIIQLCTLNYHTV